MFGGQGVEYPTKEAEEKQTVGVRGKPRERGIQQAWEGGGVGKRSDEPYPEPLLPSSLPCFLLLALITL